MSLPHYIQIEFCALRRRLWPRPTGGRAANTAALDVFYRLGPRLSQWDDSLLPARHHLSVRLVFGGHHMSVTPSIRQGFWGFWDGV